MMIKIRQIVTIIVLAIISAACGNLTEEVVDVAPSFTINARIDSLTYSTAYLAQYKDGGFVKSDSAVIEGGTFSFAGSVESPNAQYILFDDSKDRIVVFIENSEIEITERKCENNWISFK